MSAVPEVSEAAIEAAALVLADPNATTPRLPGEHIDHWQARAALTAAAPEIARAAKVEAHAEIERLHQALRDVGINPVHDDDCDTLCEHCGHCEHTPPGVPCACDINGCGCWMAAS